MAATAQESDAPPAKKVTRVYQDEITTAKAIKHRVRPKYPKEAKEKRIEGAVKMHVIIARNGSVAQIEVISGDPILAKSSMDAVRKWKYHPTRLNGDPVEVDTIIDLIFALNP